MPYDFIVTDFRGDKEKIRLGVKNNDEIYTDLVHTTSTLHIACYTADPY